jgi:CheY-like chemotaxis protein
MVDKLVSIVVTEERRCDQIHDRAGRHRHATILKSASEAADGLITALKQPFRAAAQRTNMNKKKILVVDDDSVILKAFTIKLKASNYDVLTAADGSAAVNAVRTQKPDAILLDINFPDDFGNVAWDGFRIMEWLKRLDGAAKIPIFIISSGDPNKYIVRARELGAVAFFRKPVVHEELVAALERALASEPAITT